MYSLIKYLIGSKSKNADQSETTRQPSAPPQPETQKRAEVKSSHRNKYTVYLVIEKETQNPLGIYDTIEKAKQNGQKITHYNCVIIPFKINDPCKYLFNPVFEDR